MKVLLYEHVSGGGFAGEPIPSSLLSEGYAMLRGLTADFKTAGHNVTVLLDSRLAELRTLLNADNVTQVSSNVIQVLTEVSKTAEAAFMVAPESNQILQSIIERIEALSLLSLNCQSDAIRQAADKASLPKRIRQLGLYAPDTFLFKILDIKKIMQIIRGELDFPVIIKPVNSAGCGGLSIVKNAEQIAAAVYKIKTETADSQVLVQNLIKGIPASVSLFSTGTEVMSISLNRQYVKLAPPDSESSYNGGMVSFDNPLKDEAFSAAKQVVESFNGLRGYVGVDLILTEDRVYVVEVNPRLTTSYVGLRKVASFNPAQAILDAALKKQLPRNPQCNGYSYFSKVPIPDYRHAYCEKIYRIPEVVSPPFSIANNNVAYALVESHAETADGALAGFSEAKNRLRRICAGG